MKKLMICVDLKDQLLNVCKTNMKKWNFDDVDEVHIVHGFQIQVYTDNFYFSSYPAEAEYSGIEKSVDDVLEALEKEAFEGKDYPSLKVVKKCIFSANPKGAIADYARDNEIDEMIIATRGVSGIEGLFSSSFAEYMIRHSNASLRILRPLEK